METEQIPWDWDRLNGVVPCPAQDLAKPEPAAFWLVIHVQVQYTVVQYCNYEEKKFVVAASVGCCVPRKFP